MIDCLNNYIGVRGITGYEDPDSGYYINDLQGITTQQLEDISDDTDQYEVSLAWEDIYVRASRILESDIRQGMKANFRGHSYISNQITGQIETNEDINSSNHYNGWRFDFGYMSKNLELQLPSFDIYLRSAANFDLYIFDLNTGKQLEKISYAGQEGFNTLRIGKQYAIHRYTDLFVCYDANQVETKKMIEYDPGGYTQSGQVSKSLAVTNTNFDGAITGMSITYNLECSVSNFVCQRIDWFKDAFLYKLGIEFCNERIYSDRINRYTLMDRDDAVSLRMEFKEQYKELIDNTLNDIHIHQYDECFECTRAVNHKTILP